MNMNVFDEVKARIPAVEYARFIGLELNKAGYVCCPLHHEKTPSLKFYPDGRWYCYGCHEGGSVVDFVMLYFHLDAMGAARKLNRDFLLGIRELEDDYRPTPQEQARREQEAEQRQETDAAYKAFQQWRTDFMNLLIAVVRRAWNVTKEKRMENWTDGEAAAVKYAVAAEYHLRTLEIGTMKEQVAVFKQRENIERWLNESLSK